MTQTNGKINRNKIYNMVTDRIIAEMEKGRIPWDQPWFGSGAGAISHSTGRPYSLLNQFILNKPGEYITFNQAKAEGGKVKKGAKGQPVVFWKQTFIKETDENGETVEKAIPVLRYYTVFHIDDCEGIEAKYPAADRKIPEPLKEAEKIVDAYEYAQPIKIDRAEISDRAYYSPARDYICVPALEQYERAEEYYSTLFHEMTHSTGHKSRLNRFTGAAAVAAFGSEEYSREELIAEIGSAALVNYCGIESVHSFKNSVAYLQSWMQALKNDPSMIVIAAGRAEKAFNFILDCMTTETAPDDSGAESAEIAPAEIVTESTESEKAAAKNTRKVTQRERIAAARRILKTASTPATSGTWTGKDGRQFMTSPYHMIALHCSLEELPTATGMPHVEKFLDSDKHTELLQLPDLAELRETLRKMKRDKIKADCRLYDFGKNLPTANIQYLIDVMTVLVDAEAYIIKGDKCKVNPIMFRSALGDGIVMPVRK